MKILTIVLVAMCCGRAKPAPTDPAVPDPAAAIAAAAKAIPGLGNIPGAPTPGSSPATPCASNGATPPAGSTPPAGTSPPSGTSPAAGAPAVTKPPISPPAGLPSKPDKSKPADCSTNPLKTAKEEVPSGFVGFMDTGMKCVEGAGKTVKNVITGCMGFKIPPLPTWGR